MSTEIRPAKSDLADNRIEESEAGDRLLITVVDLEAAAEIDTEVVFTRSTSTTCSTS